jgi:adenosylmethionine-8-amino-7-oxononanoate aminotransferase
MAGLDDFAATRLAALDTQGLRRALEPLSGAQGPTVRVDGRVLLNFSSNDYLGLANHEAVTSAAREALERFGLGAGASRLVTGDSTEHHALEAELAAFEGTEAALLFNSGYAANTAVLPALLGEHDVVFSDALNHASLIDGCRLSRARVVVYPHRDVAELARLMTRHRGRRQLVVTDSVFSMDGDRAPLRQLARLCLERSAALYVDEAHATGVLGARGAGLCEVEDVRPDVVMGTLSKALGASGAYVATSRVVRELLLSTARPLIFSTALPAAVVAGARAALRLVRTEPSRRETLRRHCERFAHGARRSGFDVSPDSAIFSLLQGTPEAALDASQRLRAQGLLVKAIRPPTVPEGTSRLRISLSAAHSDAHIDALVSALESLPPRARSVKPPPKPTRTAALLEADRAHVWHPFTQMQQWPDDQPLVIERAEGNWLVDTEGRRYLDAISSLWVTVHGHRRAEIDAAVKAQLEKVAHSTLLGLASVPSIELAKKLVEKAPPGLSHVFYSDSGSTAVEVAVKLAYQYWQLSGRPEKRRFVALSEAYHGDTIGSVSVGGMDLFHERFRHLLFPVERLPTPHAYRWPGRDVLAESLAAAETLFREQGHQLAGLVIEPLVQGAAGMLMQPKGYLKGLEALCRKHDVLLICDEVATGFGRTGTLFAVEQEGVRPDLLCLAKGLTGGYLPLAATLATDRVYQAFLGPFADAKTFFHGHTYTGNPLACAAALASLELFETDQTLERMKPVVEELSEGLTRLARHPNVGDVRQRGLMVGIELVKDRATKAEFSFAERMGFRVCLEARRHGVWLRPLGNVLVLMPPLSLSVDEARLLIDALEQSLEAVLPA